MDTEKYYKLQWLANSMAACLICFATVGNAQESKSVKRGGVDKAALERSFHVYLPSRQSNGLQTFHAQETAGEFSLLPTGTIDLGFEANVITKHPTLPLIYVGGVAGKNDRVPGAVVLLDQDGRYKSFQKVTLHNRYCFLSLDRSLRYLLGVDYGGGFVDIFDVDAKGMVGKRVHALDEGRKNAHCVWPTPNNQFVYIPYVKETNALYQYRFDDQSGKLTPLSPKNAEPPEGTGPRHLAYHPSLPIVYFSNEQHLGVSIYNIGESGQLKIRQVCDAVGSDRSKEGLSSSDIVITDDGRYLFAGIRGHKHDFDWISRYRIKPDGQVEHLGMTKADKIPWGFTFSPDGHYLLVTAFEGETLTAYEVGDDGDLKKAASVTCDRQIMDIVTAGHR